jgi:hypothetical protein
MIRRRRPQREIAFSFDSFLDVVANVVGIILRLILVAWVGARSYKAVVTAPPPPPAIAEDETSTPYPAPTDPLAAELPQKQTELERKEAQLQEQLHAGGEAEQSVAIVKAELAKVTARRQQLEAERIAQAQKTGEPEPAKRAAAATVAEMDERIRKIKAVLDEMAKAPSLKQTHRYRTPISKPLQTDELLFECHDGRVALIDVGTMLEDAMQRTRDNKDLLRHQWSVADETNSVGPFRLRFVVERERSALDAVTNGAPPDDRTSYRYGLTSWEVVPVTSQRGETAEQALAPGSAFRRVVDAIDPAQTAVTFWVYPDSFATYRQVRDALHDRDVVVAGRPLPEGASIRAGSHGTESRGQ